jgi:hypothetical protein
VFIIKFHFDHIQTGRSNRWWHCIINFNLSSFYISFEQTSFRKTLLNTIYLIDFSIFQKYLPIGNNTVQKNIPYTSFVVELWQTVFSFEQNVERKRGKGERVKACAFSKVKSNWHARSRPSSSSSLSVALPCFNSFRWFRLLYFCLFNNALRFCYEYRYVLYRCYAWYYLLCGHSKQHRPVLHSLYSWEDVDGEK